MTLPVNPILALHAAGVLSVVALAFRDQLYLRVTLFFSTILTMVYALISTAHPDWQGVFWNVVTLGINLWGIASIVHDRTHFGMSQDEEKLSAAFGSLSPGEFRRLLKLARWHKTKEPVTLTREGVVPGSLYYVLDGTVRIVKSGRSTSFQPRTFIGEVAFLRGVPASATVVIEGEGHYVAWPASALSRSLDRQHALRVAFIRLISADMALKVAKA